MRWWLCLALFSCIAIPSSAQTQKVDSLRQLMYAARDPREKLHALLDLCGENGSMPKDSVWGYARQARRLATDLKDKKELSRAIIYQANVYLGWGYTDTAKAMIESELMKYDIADTATNDIYFSLEQTRITCIENTSDYKLEMTEVHALMRKAEKYKKPLILADCMNELGVLYYNMDMLPEAISWFYKGVARTVTEPRFYATIASLYYNMSEYYRWVRNIDSAFYCNNISLELNRRLESISGTSDALSGRATIYITKKSFLDAKKLILESIQLMKRIDDKEVSSDKLITLASIYRFSNQPDSAIKILLDGLVMDSLYRSADAHSKHAPGDMDVQRIFYLEELARSYKLKGDQALYAATLLKIIRGKDALYKVNSAQALAEMQAKYESEKKEATIARQQLVLAKDRYVFGGVVIIAALAGVIVLLIFRDHKRRAMRAVADAKGDERRRIAADLHDNLGAQLSFIKRNVNFIIEQPRGFNQGDEVKYLTHVKDVAQTAMVDLRETIWVLNKNDIYVHEFSDKLSSYLHQQLQDKEAVEWSFQEDISQDWILPSEEAMHLFRIVQELVSNIIKHAQSSQISLSLKSDKPGVYRLVVVDNGKGFDMGHKYDGHYGLENIEQRAKAIGAKLSIESGLASGTMVVIVKEENSTFELFNARSGKFNFAE
jgi:two-component system NarL family sensor kinase